MGQGEIDYRVVGVVENVRGPDPSHDPLPEVFLLWEHYAPLVEDFAGLFSRRRQFLVVGGRQAGSGALTRVTSAALALEPELAVGEAFFLGDQVGRTTRIPRFWRMFTSVLAIAAFALAGVGVYGVSSYAVESRKHSIAVRAALGASPRRLLPRLLGADAPFVLVGALAGSTAGLAVWRLLGVDMFGVTSKTLIALVLPAFLLSFLSLAAAWPAARRACRANPADLLRAV